MDIPKHLREAPSGLNCYGIDIARKCLEIETKMLRDAGRTDAARALRDVAKALKSIVKNRIAPAVAFDWLEAPETEGEPR